MIVGIDVSRGNYPQRTGVEWYSFYLTQALIPALLRATTSVRLYSPSPPLPDWSPLPAGCQWDTIPGRFAWTQWHLPKKLFQSPPDRLFIPAYRLPSRLPIQTKAVVTIHDIGFISHPNVYSLRERLTQRWILHDTMRRSNTIIVPTDAVASEINQLPGPKPPIHVIAHGAPPEPSWQTRTPKTPLHFLYVGRIEAKKNIKILLDVFTILIRQRGLESARLTLIGKPGYGFHQVKPQLIKHATQIQWLGYCSEDRLNAYQKDAQFVILPSIVEGFGLPILEAWQWGCVPIVSDIPALREVGGNAALYASPSDPHAWLALLTALPSTPLQPIIDEGKQRLKRFNWETSAMQTANVLLTISSYD